MRSLAVPVGRSLVELDVRAPTCGSQETNMADS